MSSKYSKEFKLKVLEYYFEHGGEKTFGNKARTASHFCIDHKTVSRMLRNPEMVKKARKVLGGKKSGPESTKSSKPNIKNQPYVSIEKVVGPSSQRNSSSSSSRPSQPSKKINNHQTTSEVPIIELPEDPDFSVLKSSIDSSVSSVPHVARLLITGNAEVKYIIANECDLIFECKVCRNLFRSVINFLAHKRNYCQDKHCNVRNLFHKDTHSNMTTESSTVFVEPEPPPSPVKEESSPSDSPEPMKDAEVGNAPLSKIDKIVNLLAKKKEISESTSSSTHKGSSEYFKSIEDVNNTRKSVGTDCTVVLKNIKEVSAAVYQAVTSRTEDTVSSRKTSHQRKMERPVHLDSKGKVVVKKEPSDKPSSSESALRNEEKDKEKMEVNMSCSFCNAFFSTKKLLNAHVEEAHGLERMVYTCPICNVIFLSIWGCVKHLVRVHKKKRHQRDRLKHVICSRAYKKVFTAKEIAKHSHKSCAQISKAYDNKTDETSGEMSPHASVSSMALRDVGEKQNSPDKTKESNSRVPITGAEEESPGFCRTKAPGLPNTCPRCFQSFTTPTAMGSHLQLCSITPLSNNSETPEKKIAIQIRKDYKKDCTPAASPTRKDSGSVSNSLVTEKEEPHEILRIKKDDSLIQKKIQERLNELCLPKSLICIPCNRKYNTIHILKRHVSTHMGWTRFSCSQCSFRHYEKYVCLEHCMSVHKCKDKIAEELVIKEERVDDFIDKEIGRRISITDDVNRKVDSFQNGDCTSSECSASIVSEDSQSVKSEFDNQETESADVAYRELIEKNDEELLEINNTVEIKTEPLDIPESSTIPLKNGHNDNGEEKKLETDSKNERPQRNRKIIEQKDFVYEPLRSPIIPRPDENKIEGSTLVIPRQRIASGHTVILKIDRSSNKRKELFSPVGELTNKKTCARVLADINPHFSICNGQGGNKTVFTRTVVTGSFDKSPKPTSGDISVNKEPGGNTPNNQSSTKLSSPEQTVLKKSSEETVPKIGDKLPTERKIQLTGVKLREIPDRCGSKGESAQNSTHIDTNSKNIDDRVKTLKLAKESLDIRKSLVIKKMEVETVKSSVKNLPDKDKKPTDIEQLICRVQKRIASISNAKSEEIKNKNISNQKAVIESFNKPKSMAVIQIQKQNCDRKRSTQLPQSKTTLVGISSASIKSPPLPPPSSTLQSETKLKFKVESKQDKEPSKDQTTKTERPARKKSIDSKNL